MNWLFRIIKDLTKKNSNYCTSLHEFVKDSINVMSFNIERDKPEKNDWPIRREKIIDFILNETPGILCIQEAMPHQYKYLSERLHNYNSFYRDAFTKGSKGAIVSEGLAIFYAKDKYYSMEEGVINLSDKFGFKNENWRICHWVKLGTKRDFSNLNYTYEEVYVFNTHLDHKSKEARRIGIQKILNFIKNIKEKDTHFLPTKTKFFICGDFNAQIMDEEMIELRTWNTDYVSDGTMINRKKCIDYIFTDTNCEYNCIREIMSDHYPITAKCK